MTPKIRLNYNKPICVVIYALCDIGKKFNEKFTKSEICNHAMKLLLKQQQEHSLSQKERDQIMEDFREAFEVLKQNLLTKPSTINGHLEYQPEPDCRKIYNECIAPQYNISLESDDKRFQYVITRAILRDKQKNPATIETIAKYLKASPKQVQMHIKHLTQKGVIMIDKSKVLSVDTKKSSTYFTPISFQENEPNLDSLLQSSLKEAQPSLKEAIEEWDMSNKKFDESTVKTYKENASKFARFKNNGEKSLSDIKRDDYMEFLISLRNFFKHKTIIDIRRSLIYFNNDLESRGLPNIKVPEIPEFEFDDTMQTHLVWEFMKDYTKKLPKEMKNNTKKRYYNFIKELQSYMGNDSKIQDLTPDKVTSFLDSIAYKIGNKVIKDRYRAIWYFVRQLRNAGAYVKMLPEKDIPKSTKPAPTIPVMDTPKLERNTIMEIKPGCTGESAMECINPKPHSSRTPQVPQVQQTSEHSVASTKKDTQMKETFENEIMDLFDKNLIEKFKTLAQKNKITAKEIVYRIFDSGLTQIEAETRKNLQKELALELENLRNKYGEDLVNENLKG